MSLSIARNNFDEYSTSDKNRLVNTIVYLASKIEFLSKTRLLKLLYLLDERSTSETGIPFLGLKYEAWKNGPVERNLFLTLSEPRNDIKQYVSFSYTNNGTFLKSNIPFDDGDFSDWDISFMDKIIQDLGSKTTGELIQLTHKEDGLWDRKEKEHDLKSFFSSNPYDKSTYYTLNLKDLLNDDYKKQQYDSYLENQKIQRALDAL